MEVTRNNFNETLPLISASIEKADFLVIDAEFTGLINGKDVSIFDSPQEYYSRLLNGSTEFMLIQYGLCAFYWDSTEKQYKNDSYNFYLFPRGRPEKVFLCQSSSLNFLAAQGFDFNKLIREGISYMSEPTETKLRETLSERQKTYSTEKDLIIIPDEHKLQIEDICKKVREFLDEKKTDEMEIDRCNAFVRRLLFQELGSRFKKEAFVETKVLENQNRVLKVTRITPENDGKNRDTQKKDKEWEEFENAIGFSKVARMISQSEKLVIGHNMLLDVLHTLNHFFQPLPMDYAEFKDFTHCMFPRLLDTKYMSSLPPFKDKVNSSVLQHLFVTLSESPFTMPDVGSEAGRGYARDEGKHHEAGYDAYVTGLCFLAMYSHVARMRGDPDRVATPDSPLLKPFLNKLYLAKTAHQDSPYINLVGEDPMPSRDHVFHLTFPKEWQRNDISQLFSPFGPITVQFLDETSSLVALSRREQARDALRALASCGRASLVPYAKYKYLKQMAQQQQDRHWRKPDEESQYTNSNSNDFISRSKQVTTSAASSMPLTPQSQQNIRTPQSQSQQKLKPPSKVERRRTSTSPSRLQSLRKRTSSGVFQVDETEPLPKKSGLDRSNKEALRRRPEALSNGRRKNVTVDNDKEKKREIEKKERLLPIFDSEAKATCVSAFKESDNWD